MNGSGPHRWYIGPAAAAHPLDHEGAVPAVVGAGAVLPWSVSISDLRHPAPVLGLLVQTLRPVRGVARVVRRPEGRALALLVLVQLTGGTVFYTVTEGWGWLDALYFSVTTLATVGIGDLAPETDLGKAFTIVFVFTGVGLLATFVSMPAQQLREPATGTPAHPGEPCSLRRGRRPAEPLSR